jgi:phospholipase D1/2
MDFQTVQKFTSNALAIQDAARMREYARLADEYQLAELSAWHDTSLTIAGPSVVDLVQHFCERWNFVKKIK